MNNENIIVGKRKLTPTEKHEYQVKLYAPCTCGSGKKFKFCCKNKPRVIIKTPTTTFTKTPQDDITHIKAPETTDDDVYVYKSNDTPMFKIET